MSALPICLKPARSGNTIVEINGIKLHSSYDPVKEADRFIERTMDGRIPTTVIVLGAETGYLTTAIRQKYPQVKLLPVFYSRELYDLACPADKNGWHPQAAVSLLDYIRKNLHELELKGLKVLEWPASRAIYHNLAGEVNSLLSHVLKELSGSFFTSYALGKLWIKNSFYNFVHIDQVYSLANPGIEKPVVIAGSGPSLAAGIELIRAEREHINLWALPSAVFFLKTEKIVPDLVILTDPGFYSIYHLRSLQGEKPQILMPLSAAAGTWQINAATAYMVQPNFFEQELLKTTGAVFPDIPALGTVAATALDLAFKYTRGMVITTGLDFCYQDIQSHVLPNPFNQLLELRAVKTDPTYSQLFKRAAALAPCRSREDGTRTSQSLLTYAGWFNHLPPEKKQRIVKLTADFKTNFAVPALSCKEAACLIPKKHYPYSLLLQKEAGYPSRERRRLKALELLEKWKTEIAGEKTKSRHRSYTVDSFFAAKRIFDLAYFISLDRLNQAYHASRTGDNTESAERLTALFADVHHFLEALQAKIAANGA